MIVFALLFIGMLDALGLAYLKGWRGYWGGHHSHPDAPDLAVVIYARPLVVVGFDYAVVDYSQRAQLDCCLLNVYFGFYREVRK